MAIITDNIGNLVSGVSIPATATGAANAGVTLTITAPPAGQFVYLTSLSIVRVSTAVLAGTAVLVITSTNIPGSPAWSTGNVMAAGQLITDVDRDWCGNPIKASAAAVAVTIVAPAPGAAVLWRINATYYYAA